MHEKLLQWITGDCEPSAVKLVTGPGGCGKTRLMAEICYTLHKDHHWHTGFLPSQQNFEEISDFIKNPPNQRPLLIVVDGAEGRMSEVKKILRAITMNKRVKLVLLARSNGGWWDSAKSRSEGLRGLPGSTDESVIEQMITSLTPEMRMELFYSTADEFMSMQRNRAGKAGKEVPKRQPSDRSRNIIRENEIFKFPLYVVIAAINYIFNQTIEKDKEALLKEVCNREFLTWPELIGEERYNRDEDIVDNAVRNAVCQATLAGGTKSESETKNLLDCNHSNRENRTIGVALSHLAVGFQFIIEIKQFFGIRLS